jgi:hypothetical protein
MLVAIFLIKSTKPKFQNFARDLRIRNDLWSDSQESYDRLPPMESIAPAMNTQ